MSKFKGNFNAAAGRHTYFSERNRAGDYCRGGPASSEHRESIVEYLNSYSSRFFVTFAAPSTFGIEKLEIFDSPFRDRMD